MDKKKSLLESLRDLTPRFNYGKSEEEVKGLSIRDIAEPKEDDEDDLSLDSQNLEDDEHSDHEEDGEEGEDEDGDGDEDNVHALSKLKNAFESSDDEIKHALIMFTRIMLDTEIDLDTLQQFIDEVDSDEEGEEGEEDDGEGFDDEDDMYGDDDDSEGDEYGNGEEDEDESSNEELSDEDEEYAEFKNELYNSSRENSFLNEGTGEDYDMFDMLD